MAARSIRRAWKSRGPRGSFLSGTARATGWTNVARIAIGSAVLQVGAADFPSREEEEVSPSAKEPSPDGVMRERAVKKKFGIPPAVMRLT